MNVSHKKGFVCPVRFFLGMVKGVISDAACGRRHLTILLVATMIHAALFYPSPYSDETVFRSDSPLGKFVFDFFYVDDALHYLLTIPFFAVSYVVTAAFQYLILILPLSLLSRAPPVSLL